MKCIIIMLLMLGIVGMNDAVFAASSSLKSGVTKQQKNKEDDKKFELYYFWENYVDEYLSSYVFEALEKNPSLKIANDRLRQSQALLEQLMLKDSLISVLIQVFIRINPCQGKNIVLTTIFPCLYCLIGKLIYSANFLTRCNPVDMTSK